MCKKHHHCEKPNSKKSRSICFSVDAELKTVPHFCGIKVIRGEDNIYKIFVPVKQFPKCPPNICATLKNIPDTFATIQADFIKKSCHKYEYQVIIKSINLGVTPVVYDVDFKTTNVIPYENPTNVLETINPLSTCFLDCDGNSTNAVIAIDTETVAVPRYASTSVLSQRLIHKGPAVTNLTYNAIVGNGFYVCFCK